MEKYCTKCGELKPLSEFHNQKKGKYGKISICKPCALEEGRRWKEANRERCKRKLREWKEKNKDRLIVIYKRYYLDSANKAWRKYSEIKRNCKTRGIPLDWEREDFIEWFNAQEKTCHYCHTPINRGKIGARNMQALTLDRKDSNIGYNKENVVLACRRCNQVKTNILSEQQMLEVAQRYFIDKII